MSGSFCRAFALLGAVAGRLEAVSPTRRHLLLDTAIRCGCVVCAFFAVLLSTSAVSAQSFTLIGKAPNAASSRGYAVSGDGSTVVGTSYRDPSPAFSAGFRWTLSDGRVDEGLSPELTRFNTFNAVSSDGSVVAGYGASGTHSHAMRYAGPGTYRDLGVITGHNNSEAFGLSADGSIVVGQSTFYDTRGNLLASSAFRWTESGGMQSLTSTYSAAYGVSADGNTVVGEIRDLSGINAFRWTAGGGLQVLPALTSPASSYAYAVSSDGSTTVGSSGNFGAIWRDGSSIAVSSPGIVGAISFHAVSGNGSVAAGYAFAGTTGFAATVWTPGTGAMYLSDYLAANGVAIPAGVNLYECTGVSADGRTFVGWTGSSSQGGAQAFVTTIPAPGALALVAALTPYVIRRSR